MTKPLADVDAMYLEGIEMKRQQFRRTHPQASAQDIEALIRQWIEDRPVEAPGRIVRP